MMDARLLEYYNRELSYLREMGAEFARKYPKVASRLGMGKDEVADPYVERLLEGFSFLTARVQLKMDAEFPRFSQRLLEVVYPNYLAPIPSMAVVGLSPSLNEGSLAKGFQLRRGTLLRAYAGRGEQTPCEFSTAQDVTIWPLTLMKAELTGVPTDLPLTRWGFGGRGEKIAAALRLRFAVGGGLSLGELDLDKLTFFLNGPDVAMSQLLELILTKSSGIICHDTNRPATWSAVLPASAIGHEGFGDDQALLPVEARSFQGYRLMQEYFAFPQRILFFSVSQLRKALRGDEGRIGQKEARSFDMTILLSAAAPQLEGTVVAENIALNCVPAVNLFAKRPDRVVVSPRTNDYHVVVDRSRPLDYEIYAVTRTVGHGVDGKEREFRPFYAAQAHVEEELGGAYYALRREPRLPSGSAVRAGRSGYVGSEVFLSLVDKHEAPFSDGLRHLTLDALCTNRDLPMLLPQGGTAELSLSVSAPVSKVSILRGPSPPRPPMAEGAAAWRLISHLGLHYQSLADSEADRGAESLRELLSIYADVSDPVVGKQIAGLHGVRLKPVHQRIPMSGPIVFGRGVRIELTVDETAFSGISPFLLGAVLERFFSRHVAINMMTELEINSLQRGVIARWKPRHGSRPVC